MENPHFRPAANGAFTPVSVRRTFSKPTHSTLSTPTMVPTSSHSASAPENTKRDWPPAVRAYVSRAFALENNVPGVGREEMETRLKKVISEAAASDTLLTVDWINLPLPQHMIMQDRTAHAQLLSNSLYSNGVTPLTLHETNYKAHDSSSKKRKSSEMDTSQQSPEKIPPWRQNGSNNVFEDRVTFADKRQKNDTSGEGSSKSER